MIKYLALGLGALFCTVAVVPIMGVMLLWTAGHQLVSTPPTAAARADIPRWLMTSYLDGGLRCEIPWNVLAAVAKIDNDHGRAGPLVFSVPGATEAAVGSIPDPQLARHNILTFADWLCESPDPADLNATLTQYNPDPTWVDQVLAQAEVYGALPDETPEAPEDPSTVTVTPGDVDTTLVGGIRVSVTIADKLAALLAAAAADGHHLTGGGYRNAQQQIDKRAQNCHAPDAHYAIYEMPPRQCHPQTAIPGTSMHEKGLAIDFENCANHKTDCWQWLHDNAARFGFFNLPAEPWHWSTNGN